jgi:ABC-2 type transport system permease protein
MSILLLIIKREFLAKVRNKSFVVMTFLSPLLFVGITALIAYLNTIKADVRQIAIHDESGVFQGVFQNNDEYVFVNESHTKLQTLTDSLQSGFYNGVLHIPKVNEITQLESTVRYISNESPPLLFMSSLEKNIADRITLQNLQKAKLDTAAINNAQANVTIALSKPSGEEALKGLNEIKIAIGTAFGYLIMMFIIIYGNMVMRSVIEEKTNRIVEIIISSVKPFTLMMGKIVGTTLAGLLQFSIWVVIGFLFLLISTSVLGIDAQSQHNAQFSGVALSTTSIMQQYIQELWNLPIAAILLSFFFYFICGYFLYSSIYAAIGAAVDNETDSQQFLLPVIMPLVIGVYIGFFTVVNDPHGSMATIFSIIPLTSPIVMLMRIPFGVPWWELLLSMFVLISTFLIVVWFSAKIYRVGILMYGKKPTFKELFKWMKY